MPEDRTPIEPGLARPQPEELRIPQPKPRADEDERELVPGQQTHDEGHKTPRGGHTDFTQQSN